MLPLRYTITYLYIYLFIYLLQDNLNASGEYSYYRKLQNIWSNLRKAHDVIKFKLVANLKQIL